MKRKTTIIFTAAILACGFIFTSCKSEAEKNKCEITISFDGEEVSGTCVYDFYDEEFLTSDKPDREESAIYPRSLEFFLPANAYKKDAKNPPADKSDSFAYPNGFSEGSIKINSVKVNGETADNALIDEDLTTLCVSMKNYSPQKTTVEIDFTTVVPDSLLRLGKNGDKVNLGDFYPLVSVKEEKGYYKSTYSKFGDPYYTDLFDYKVSITLPSEYVVASSGTPTSTVVDGFKTTYSYAAENCRHFAFVLGKNFIVDEKKTENGLIALYADKKEQETLDLIADVIKYFSETFGPYPYETFSVAITGFKEGGMEYTGLCFISDALSDEQKKLAIAHETAHEWWYSAVGNDQIASAYLDEGLCEYSTYLYFSARGDQQTADRIISSAKSAYKSFYDLSSVLSGKADTSMNRPLGKFSSDYEYVNVAYNKSLLAFYEYEKATGRNKTIKGLKKYYEKNKFAFATLDLLTDSLGLKDFFKSYVEGSVLI